MENTRVCREWEVVNILVDRCDWQNQGQDVGKNRAGRVISAWTLTRNWTGIAQFRTRPLNHCAIGAPACLSLSTSAPVHNPPLLLRSPVSPANILSLITSHPLFHFTKYPTSPRFLLLLSFPHCFTFPKNESRERTFRSTAYCRFLLIIATSLSLGILSSPVDMLLV